MFYTGPNGEQADVPWTKDALLNHVGIKVDDLAATAARIERVVVSYR